MKLESHFTYLEALLWVKKNIATHPDRCGICETIERYYNDVVCLNEINKHFPLGYMERQIWRWPGIYRKKVGDFTVRDWEYPVDGWNEYHGEFHSKTLWDNPRRLALLDFLIGFEAKQIALIIHDNRTNGRPANKNHEGIFNCNNFLTELYDMNADAVATFKTQAKADVTKEDLLALALNDLVTRKICKEINEVNKE